MNDPASDPKFVVVDIETTGLDPKNNLILEIGMIVTDVYLNDIARMSYVLGLPDLPSMDDVVYEMHTKSGLLDEVAISPNPYYEVRDAFIFLLKGLNATGLPMCGSSVHFDRAFLKEWMPSLEELFHYRNIDVSTLKGLCELWNPQLIEKAPTARKLHRSIPDCEDTINELRYYRDEFLYIESEV